MIKTIQFTLNDKPVHIEVDSERTLLEQVTGRYAWRRSPPVIWLLAGYPGDFSAVHPKALRPPLI
mgnify:CR=1 FL=1